MYTTCADIEDGERIDVTAEFISQRTVALKSGRGCRLLFADRTGTQFAVLLTSDHDTLGTLMTGERYHLSGVLGAAPITSDSHPTEGCPDCGDDLRGGQTVDTVDPVVFDVASHLNLTDVFGIADTSTSLVGVPATEDTVDDWVSMNPETPSDAPPDYVCTSCGRHVAEYDLGRDHRIDDLIENQAMTHDTAASPAAMEMGSQDTVGIATGGAKDITSFRENVAEGFTPQPEAISDEGLFYDYYFETGGGADTEALFSPRYATAVSEHPLTGSIERYLSVGLESTLSADDFERPRLDLVCVLDVSGSMDSPFDAYYYDEHGRRREAEDAATTKLDAATQSLCALTEQLRDDDRLGVVLYNHRAHVAKPIRDVATTDMPAIRRHIREIAAGGSTNLADGFEAAVDMLVDDAADPRVECRVVFMTDMMPNTGMRGEAELTTLFANTAAEGVHTTFIGMGLDANAELADVLSGIRGANHYFIHSAEEFERRLGDEFDYMVTPLVYDLTLELDADGYSIAAVHGSPSDSDERDRLKHVGTLFPSAKQAGEARGGVVLVRLERVTADADVDLVASWTERDGGEYTERVTVDIPTGPETFAHPGVRKAVALARYAGELRAWARDVHDRADGATGVDDWLLPDRRERYERESVPLVVPEAYAGRFDRLRRYLETEMDALADDTLQREIDLLTTLCQEAPRPPSEVTE
jgi:Ca-activated chloride channel family protein